MDLMGFPHPPLFQAEPSLARNCQMWHLMGLPKCGQTFRNVAFDSGGWRGWWGAGGRALGEAGRCAATGRRMWAGALVGRWASNTTHA